MSWVGQLDVGSEDELSHQRCSLDASDHFVTRLDTLMNVSGLLMVTDVDTSD